MRRTYVLTEFRGDELHRGSYVGCLLWYAVYRLLKRYPPMAIVDVDAPTVIWLEVHQRSEDGKPTIRRRPF
jgi:hypothetical protein